MASTLRIVDLNGKTINIFRGQDQTWADVVSRAKLPARFEFCLRHWMSDDPVDTETEERIKAYLSRVGYILIQDKPDGRIITDYKELRDKVAMIPVSGYPKLENLYYGNLDEMSESGTVPGRENSERMTKAEKKVYDALTKPKRVPASIKKMQEKRKRIDEVRAKHPGANFVYAIVDTDNDFTFKGKRYHIDHLRQYEPKAVRDDLLYDMDHVVCVKDKGNVFFYDEDFYDITVHVSEV